MESYKAAKYLQLLNSYQESVRNKKNESVLLDHLMRVAQQSRIPVDNTLQNTILQNIILGEWHMVTTNQNKQLHIYNSFPVTTIVGNPNSHKRNLALARAFSFLRNNPCRSKHRYVLIVLLNKNPEEMRKKMICPALASKYNNQTRERIGSDDGNTDYGYKDNKASCLECYNHISFLNVNPGCITPEEFLSMLKDHIHLYKGYNGVQNNAENNKNCFRDLLVIFDDYHRLDFNYPFLSSSNLFASALINLCQSNKVGLTILCDKNSKRVREVCTLSDYVMCIKREETLTDGLILYTERTGDEAHSSSIYRYELHDLRNLFICRASDSPASSIFRLSQCNINFKEIASMKEYWRETINIINSKS